MGKTTGRTPLVIVTWLVTCQVFDHKTQQASRVRRVVEAQDEAQARRRFLGYLKIKHPSLDPDHATLIVERYSPVGTANPTDPDGPRAA